MLLHLCWPEKFHLRNVVEWEWTSELRHVATDVALPDGLVQAVAQDITDAVAGS